MTILQALQVHELALYQIRTRTKLLHVRIFLSSLLSQEPNRWTLHLGIWGFLQVMKIRSSLRCGPPCAPSYVPSCYLPNNFFNVSFYLYVTESLNSQVLLFWSIFNKTNQNQSTDRLHKIQKFPPSPWPQHKNPSLGCFWIATQSKMHQEQRAYQRCVHWDSHWE